jgi:hypothetical protein
MPKKFRYVICGVPEEKKRQMDEFLYQLIHNSVIKMEDVHIREEPQQ